MKKNSSNNNIFTFIGNILVSAFLLLILLVGLISNCINNINSGSEGVLYNESSCGTGYVVAGIGSFSGEELVIPSKYNGKPVIEISNSAFEYCDGIKSVKISKGIKSIGNYAFYYCTSLQSIEIPNSVTSIGASAFDNCTSLTSITIPNSVGFIGERAFYKCKSLIYTVEDDLNYLGNKINKYLYLAGVNSTSITTANIKKGCRFIGFRAFEDCSLLENIILPDSVTSISNYAFYGCTSLAYTVENNLKYLGNNSNKHFALVGTDSTSITTATVKQECILIAGAFMGCSSLQSVTIGNNVTSIGASAFYGCRSLQSIKIPNSVTSIGYNAFSGCNSLTSITIGSGVTSIGYNAFSGCNSLNKVNYLGTIDSWVEIEFEVGRYSSVTYSMDANPLSYAGNFYINNELVKNANINNVTKINDGVFYKCTSLESVTVSDNVTSIGNSAFSYCYSLTSVTIGNSVTNIGNNAFFVCDSLRNVTIGNSVKRIGFHSFDSCYLLNSITIPNTVKYIDEGAFEMTSLASLTYLGTIKEFKNVHKSTDWNKNTSLYYVKCNDGTYALYGNS